LFPFFQIGPVEVYIFGLFLSLCFFVFLYMLKKTSDKFHFNFNFFAKDIVWYFLSVFFFSRLFYVISNWGSLKFIDNPFAFFLMNDYNFSIFWAIFGFFIILYINVRIHKRKIEEFVDGVFLAFIIAASVGYIWALFGGQVYGLETSFGIELSYTHPFTPVPYKVPVFPLPIIYSIMSFVIFSIFYTSHMFTEKRGLIGYLGFICFGAIVIIFDTFSGKFDTLQAILWIHFSQLFAFILIGLCMRRLYIIMKQDPQDAALQK